MGIPKIQKIRYLQISIIIVFIDLSKITDYQQYLLSGGQHAKLFPIHQILKKGNIKKESQKVFTYNSFSPDIQDCSTSGLIFIAPLTYIFILQKMRSKIKSQSSSSPQKNILSKQNNISQDTLDAAQDLAAAFTGYNRWGLAYIQILLASQKIQL